MKIHSVFRHTLFIVALGLAMLCSEKGMAFSKHAASTNGKRYRVSLSNPVRYNLFFIERSGNSNRIHYDIRLKPDGEADETEPIEFYRVKPDNYSKKLPLSWFEVRFAYGIRYKVKTALLSTFNFVAYGGRDFILRKNSEGKYRVFTTSYGRQIEVLKLFIHITGGTVMLPKVTRIDLYGLDAIRRTNTVEFIFL